MAAQIINFGRSFIAGAEQGGVNAFVQMNSEFGGLFVGELAIVFCVGVRHVGEADAEAVVVRADERIRSLQIDVIADHDQRALR